MEEGSKVSKIKDFILTEEENGRRPVMPMSMDNLTESATQHIAPKQAVSPIVEYWQCCRNVVLAAGTVAAYKKLIQNYESENTRHVVAPIVENKEYYPNGIKDTHEALQIASNEYDQKCDHLNELACKNNLHKIIPQNLLSRLYDKRMRDKYKQRIKRYEEEEHPPIALDEILL